MAIYTVEWASQSKLSCAGCSPVEVVFCTRFDTFPAVEALLISFRTQTQKKCGGGGNCITYVYKFQYENDDLDFTPFLCTDITGAFCKGCLTSWVDAQLPRIVNEIDYVQSHDFLAAPDTPFDLNVSVTNFSTTKEMQALAQWGFAQNFSSTIFGDLTGVTLQLYIDGVPITTFVNAFSGITTPPVNITTAGLTGVHPFVILPGQTNLVTLTLTPVHGAILPDTIWQTRHMYLSVYGVTA